MAWSPSPNPQNRKVLVIHDTDVHGTSCGINALYALQRSGIEAEVYSHFSTSPSEPATTPQAVASVIENLGNVDIIMLDIPVDIRNPKRYVDALVGHAQFKGRVLWADHHGHSQWVDVLNRNGVTAIVVGSSYELSMLVPRMYGKVDSFTEKWALVGAVADFDETVRDRVPVSLEIDVAEFLDQAMKFRREQLADALGIGYEYRQYLATRGNVGALSYAIAQRGIEPEQVIAVAKTLVSPIQLPPYSVVGDVVFTVELPAQGLAWKTAWKLCAVTGAKVAIVPSYNPRTNQYAIIVAKSWRHPEVTDIVEQYVQRRFAGRQIVGHPGARSIAMMSLDEARSTIPQVARELAEAIASRIYTPQTVRLLSESSVARALHEDFRRVDQQYSEIMQLLRRIAEALERGASAKEQQVQLLKDLYERDSRTRYD